MLKFDFSAAAVAVGAALLGFTAAAPAEAASTLWTGRDANGFVVLDDWPLGPDNGAGTAFTLRPTPSTDVATSDFLGFQFDDQGKLWTARDANGFVVLDDWPLGPDDGAGTAFTLHPTPLTDVATSDFLGFQFDDQGKLWTARDANGFVVLDDWPLGPDNGAGTAFTLHPTPSTEVATSEFLGFQFDDQGKLWTARNANGFVVLDDWPLGPDNGAGTAFTLRPTPLTEVATSEFLGFEFDDEGKLWTARDANGFVVLDDWPLGPDNGAGTAFTLRPTPSTSVATSEFLGFQFVAGPADPGTAVPEPATWALLIMGFGLAGGSLRRRRAMA